ncbi:MAG: hypothetical protein P8J32_02680 [bacterium]|nr:hypothetical protein [bacterium]
MIKFRNIDDEKEVYDKLFELAGGKTFLPIDADTFVLATNKTKKTVRGILTFDLESNILLVDVSDNQAEDFFIDNTFDNSHIRNFVEEFHKERDKYNSKSDETLSELDILLEKVHSKGVEELTGYERKRLDELSRG